jgi:hypothetical protein
MKPENVMACSNQDSGPLAAATPWISVGVAAALLFSGVGTEAQAAGTPGVDTPIVTIRPAPSNRSSAPSVSKVAGTRTPRRRSAVRRRLRRKPTTQLVNASGAARRTRTIATTGMRRRSTRRFAASSTETRVARREGPVTLNGRAYRLQRRGRHAEAEPLLRRALELNPDFSYALYNLGWSLVAQGRAREALEPLKRTVAMQPRRWEPYQRLSEAYSQLGEAEKAAAYARDASFLRTGRRTTASTKRQTAPEPQEPKTEIAPIVISE